MADIADIVKPCDSAASRQVLPLTGLKVIDITHARAGPTAVRHLADWGADVIRVDQPLAAPGSAAHEDVTGRQRGSDYQNLHRNKRSLRLNLKDPAGRAVLLDLVKDADIVIENMRPAVKHRLAIAYEDLCAINPRLIYGSISGFGQTGPYSDRPGLDQIAQGMTGLMSVTGHAGSPPLRTGIAVGDLSAGNMLALAIMMALYERQQTGRGRWVHTSLIESLLFMLDFQAARWLIDREIPKSVGNEHPTAIPTGVFEAADGHITLAAPNSRMWPKMCEAIGRPDWAQRSEWSTRDGRATHREEIHAGIAEVVRARTMQYWIEKLNAVGVTCDPIYTMDQVFDDEQVQLLGMACPVTHPVLGELRLVASPLNFEGSERTLRRSTPDGGADTDQILRDLGYGEEKIRNLKASKVC
ncbi:MAG: L-carnitine dehydratase/bile acid-inducible protein F [uncultured Paraburkholderia sp.]|uniref:CaiB/BaiF CoA transferase family protein n=1 Tax=uncultured Paraburkholderia sp. TaxID=1822466 RepID=UPI002597BC8D|nr:CoA transferase [uncultured Paraburkholderia sp.]CAH2894517.1 MAG: L-carnitine dehydratase/bile acid-inducible protein F [uncultured Paraburkholderia sp.]CAH2910586.1 MAG: L-carnitine dehydratase/bile acid-inducible protein F [uncultured Paraburkholderia sp.]